MIIGVAYKKQVSCPGEEALRIIDTIKTMNPYIEAIVSFNEDRQIIQFDSQAEQMFGYSVGEVLQCTLDKLFPVYSGKKYEAQLKLFARSENGVKREGWLEMWAIRKTGEEFPVEVDITKFRANGKFIFTAVFKEWFGA